ncbi:MAG: Na/Pi cotransporter family protein, partial [Bacteroidota bacterium]
MMNGWILLGGIAIFLMGTGMMEEAIRQLAGRRFKLFLKRSTEHPLKAVGSGAFVTALLQSSSVVNLFVLSLVGSGVMRMRQALAVMLGANLGTTFTSWMIAMIGFNLNLESYALPVFGLSGMLMYYAGKDSSLRVWARLFAGFSLLFWGLGFMQKSMQELVLKIDFSVLTGYHLIIFLFAGMIITGIVQASSVTIAITLSALHSNVINIQMAAALVLGAEIGTTFKLALASYKGSAAKKRVAS